VTSPGVRRRCGSKGPFDTCGLPYSDDVSNPRLLVIQPDASDPVGPLGGWLAGAGADLDIRLPPRDQVPASLDDHDGVVVLGGGMGAEDDETHPWLADVRRLLAHAIGTSAPVLGVCLGAQMLAVVTGGRVRRGQEGPEIGPALVAKKDAAWTDPLCAGLPLMQDVIQFHTDVIELLPPGAELLASAPKYPNQAFRLGRHVYGLQFHIETTPAVVLDWVRKEPDLAALAKPETWEAESLERVHEDVGETWRPFAERFVQLVRGELEPAAALRRSLPFA
jgi:GMP synthase-like glutamine amidotransferase